ncbi:MAG: hypothetical protein IT373_16890 [Polyangiaceae bacterium]|nr:hypothetical protein [Polyangiaceae bacterium]
MCHCITPEALLAGLVRRVVLEGYTPTRADLEALERLGCARPALDQRLAALAAAGAPAVAPERGAP